MLTQEDHKEMRRLREKGMSYAEIASLFGVSRQRATVVIDPEAYQKQLARNRRWYRRKHDTGSTGLL